jgi:tetratricopeptide (TPR) repeat protein
MTSWGEERLTAVDRTLTLMPDFAPARFVAAMVFIARQAFRAAEEVVAKGAVTQSRQACAADSLFPAFGLHWLGGLLHLRSGSISGALVSFAKEIDEARETSVYFREFRVNALIGAGYAHLAIDDASGAAEAFRAALETLPSNGRVLLGLERALSKTGFASDAGVLRARIDRSIEELTRGGRQTEAAFVAAANLAARGRHEMAIEILDRLLERAPAGHTGWIIPVDPSLASLREHPAFERVLARLATRAS